MKWNGGGPRVLLAVLLGRLRCVVVPEDLVLADRADGFVGLKKLLLRGLVRFPGGLQLELLLDEDPHRPA